MRDETLKTAAPRCMSQTEAELREQILNSNVMISILKSENEKKDMLIASLKSQVDMYKEKLHRVEHIMKEEL